MSILKLVIKNKLYILKLRKHFLSFLKKGKIINKYSFSNIINKFRFAVIFDAERKKKRTRYIIYYIFIIYTHCVFNSHDL